MTRYIEDWRELPVGSWVTLYETPDGWTDADRRTGRELTPLGVYVLSEVGNGYVRTNWFVGERDGSVMRVQGQIEISVDGIS